MKQYKTNINSGEWMSYETWSNDTSLRAIRQMFRSPADGDESEVAKSRVPEWIYTNETIQTSYFAAE